MSNLSKWLSSFETMLPELHYYWRHLKMLKVQFINIYTLILAHYQWLKLHILHSGKFYQRWVKYQSYIHIPSSKQHKKGSELVGVRIFLKTLLKFKLFWFLWFDFKTHQQPTKSLWILSNETFNKFSMKIRLTTPQNVPKFSPCP